MEALRKRLIAADIAQGAVVTPEEFRRRQQDKGSTIQSVASAHSIITISDDSDTEPPKPLEKQQVALGDSDVEDDDLDAVDQGLGSRSSPSSPPRSKVTSTVEVVSQFSEHASSEVLSGPSENPSHPATNLKSIRNSRKIILDSDEEDEGEDDEPQVLVSSTISKSVAISVDSSQTDSSYRPSPAPRTHDAMPLRTVNANMGIPPQSTSLFRKAPTVIKPPSLPNPSLPFGTSTTFETFDEPDFRGVRDYRTTAADAEKALQDLISDSMNDVAEEVDMSLAEVEGFSENIRLLPHQVIGRVWMKERETGNKRGGILADDMGLGKTIQTLARIMDGRPKKSDKELGFSASTLVVCPLSLVSQWASEIEKMAPGLRVMQHHGPSRERDPQALSRAHVIVTSYTVVSSEHATYLDSVEPKDKSKSKKKKGGAQELGSEDESDDSAEHFGRTVRKAGGRKTVAKKKPMHALFGVKWWRIVLDEAHNIKNRKTKAALGCSALQGRFRWCLTGTPMQNNVEEIYSLLCFLQIRPLNDWDKFNEQINKPIKAGRAGLPLKRLHVVLKAVMLRRKKDSLLNGKPLINLPGRICKVIPCEFDDEEREFYNNLKDNVQATLNNFMKSGNINSSYTYVLLLLLRLRQACNHMSLITKNFSADKEALDPKAPKDSQDLNDGDDLADLLGKMEVTSSRKCALCQTSLAMSNTSSDEASYCSKCENLAAKSRRKSLAPNSLPPSSAKVRMTLKLLDDIEDRSEGIEKTIIFSQFTTMLDLLQPFLKDRGIKHVRYDGSMKKEDREVSLENIRNDPSVKVILISFKAGNTGLNLTACNNVILVDLWWNPALEEQAFDRAHRFGQTKQVNIFKLTVEGTVEERILELQEKKRELAAAALSGEKIKGAGKGLGMDEMLALFRPSGGEDDDEYVRLRR